VRLDLGADLRPAPEEPSRATPPRQRLKPIETNCAGGRPTVGPGMFKVLIIACLNLAPEEKERYIPCSFNLRGDRNMPLTRAIKHKLRLLVLLAVAASAASGCNDEGGARWSSQTRSTSATSQPHAVPALVVRESESPAGHDSREPELFASADGRVILS
jgi:hypothetical protein